MKQVTVVVYFDGIVINKLNNYVDFLLKSCDYHIDEALIRTWEILYGLRNALHFPYCNPKVGSSNAIRKAIIPYRLQRQEIRSNIHNIANLERILKRRKGSFTSTTWIFTYKIDEESGDILVYQVNYSNVNSESKVRKNTIIITESKLKHIISEAIRKVLYN